MAIKKENLRKVLEEIAVTKPDLDAASKTFDAPYIAEKTAQLRELISRIEEAIKDSGHCPAGGYKTIVVDMAERGNFEGALEIAAKISHEHTQSEAYNSLLSAMVEKEGLDSLVSVVDEIGSPYCKARAYVTMASAQCDAGEQDKAAHTLESALKSLRSSKAEKYFKQEVIAEIAAGQAKAGNYKQAMKTAGRIKCSFLSSRNFKQAMDTASSKSDAYEGISIAQAKAGNYKQAMKTAGRIKCSFLSSKHVKTHTRIAKSHTYEGISIAMAERGDFDQALSIVSNYLDECGQHNTCNAIAVLQVEAGKDAEALKTAELMTKNEELWQPPGEGYSIVMHAQFERGDIDAARETAQILGSPKNSQGLAIGLAKAGKYDEAIEIVKRFPEEFSVSHVHLIIATSRAKAGEYKEALDVCKMGDKSGPILTEYRAIATIMAERNDFDEALEVAEKSTHPALKLTTYCNIAGYMASAGEVDRAKQTFRLASRAAVTERDPRTKDVYYGFIAAAQAKAGFIDDAEKTLNNNVSYASAITETALHIELAKADRKDFDGAITSLKSLLRVTDSISTRNRCKHRMALMNTCYQVIDKLREAA